MQVTNVRAPFIALASAAVFGLSTPFAKLLIGNVSPWLLAGLLYLDSGIGPTILFLVRKSIRPNTDEASLVRRDLPWLAGTVFLAVS